MNRNIKIITHTDLDGVSAGILLRKVYNTDNIAYVNYDELQDELRKTLSDGTEHLIISDLGVNKELIDTLLFIKDLKITVYDHHQGSQQLKDIKDILEVHVDMSTCATKIIYSVHADVLHEYKQYVEVVNDHDLWLNKEPESKNLSIIFGFLDREDFINKFSSNPQLAWGDCERKIIKNYIRKEAESINSLPDRLRVFVDTYGHAYALIYADQFYNTTSAKLLEDGIVDYVVNIILNIKPKDAHTIGVVSLRGNGKIDVGHIARTMGGGGHTNAAAFYLQNWQSNYFKKEINI